ncbi:extracellular solute-binding protein [Haloarchaeobius iranensis]|uniref:Iron(III) transport system substrate-binding protein n=1 Tax=Haloarchaeobius iranensis TaxID=996166 RepID=A0A1G9TVJ3_9EURY|nr:extracellular solute-binding protein [Haloarchaeobius iranensis]SDM51780.1 iron(III) transport system substrate-binding protein [Haloarchaeobius iranensis]
MNQNDHDTTDAPVGRRRFLAAASAAGVAATAGCIGSLTGDNDDSSGDLGLIGSGMDGRPAPGGTPMADMPDLSGTLTLYSGRGEPLVNPLLSYIEDQYDDFTVDTRYEASTTLANQIETAGTASEADVFFSVNAGALGLLADADRTVTLPDDVQELVPTQYRAGGGAWVGTSGRARTIPYNTGELSAADVPEDIFAIPDTDFASDMGWAPSYGSFQGFLTAMRVMAGREKTKAWLEGMLEAGVSRYSDEFIVSRAVANGELTAGFANHYYIQRVLANDEDAPIGTAFTQNDAGAIFNVAGAAVVDSTGDESMSTNFVRHLLSAEAQEYFATRTFEYPLIPEVEPVGDLPPVDELATPDFDLAQLSDIGPTIDLMREVGIQV